MVVELPESLRQLAIVFITKAWVAVRDDPSFDAETEECEALMRALGSPREERAKITIDQEHGFVYINLLGQPLPADVHRCVVDEHGVAMDFDGKGHLIGISMIDRGRLHPELEPRREAR